MSAFDEWAAGEGRDIVDFQTVRGLTLDADGLAADALDIRIRLAFQAGRDSVADLGGAAQRAIDGFRQGIEMLGGQSTEQAPWQIRLKRIAPLGDVAEESGSVEGRQPAHDRLFAAGPWIPGEPPEECKKPGARVLSICDDATIPDLIFWGLMGGRWRSSSGDDPDEIHWHARINLPKQEGGEG